MRIKDGIKLQGPFVEIPDCPRGDLPQFFVEKGYKVGAEVGVYKGAFTEKFCKAGLEMYAIDPWQAYSGGGKNMGKQARQDFLYGHTQRTLAPCKNCTIIRTTSMDASKKFSDNSLDFVYIDGDHSFRHVMEDISEWSKKVKPGGIISGHDYFYYGPESNLVCQVKPVVDAFVKTYDIPCLYIFGKIENSKDKDDKYPSWMFVKPRI